jgi:hypothetical protein
VNFNAAGPAQTLMINSPVTVSGLAAAGMVWETPIGSVPANVVDGGLIKAGSGLMILNPAWQIGGGATVSGSDVVTVTTTTGLTVGMPVFGANIPAGSLITEIISGTTYRISANATAAATGQTFSHVPVNMWGDFATPTDVFNVQSGIVRVDNHGALGSANAVTTVQDGATLLMNFPGATLGSLRLKDGATLSVTLNSAILGPVGSTGTLAVPAGATADVFVRDFYVPNTNNGNIVVNHKVTGGGTLNLEGITFAAGYNGGGLFQLRNPSNDFTGIYRLGNGSILEASTSNVSGTGSTIAGAGFDLNGGTFRIRDNGDGSTNVETLAYGNAFTLSNDSFMDLDRQSGAATNKRIAFGPITVAAGEHALNTVYGTGNPIAGNAYRAVFSELNGPGTLVKGGSRLVEIGSYGAGFTGGIGIAGPDGLTLPASGNLILPDAAGSFTKFSVSGFHAFTAGSINAAVLEVTNNTGVVPNGWAGITTGEVTGAISVTNGSTVAANVLRNNGMVSSNGSATITAQAITGKGLYNAFGQDLILNGVLADEGAITTRLKAVASSSAAVTLTASASGNTGGAEVQNGTLRIAPAGPASNPLGTGGIRVHGAPAMAAATNSQAVAAVNAILEFAGSAISQAGDIQNNGTIRVSGGVTTLTGAVIGGPDTLSPENFLANTVPGLLEGTTGSSDFSTNRTPNPGNFGIKMEPRMAQTNVVTQDIRLGWTDNTAWVYTGYFYDADGVFTFAENIDDNSFISIDGVTRLLNNSATNPWQTVTSTATTIGQRGTLIDTAITNTGTPQGLAAIPANPSLPDGWHSIEIRVHNGGGGGGAVAGNGFHNNFGLGLNPNGTMALDGTQFLRPIDPGDGTLFRTAAFGKGSIEVAATSTLNVARLESAGTLRFAGADGRINLTGTGTASTSDRIETLNLSYLNLTANSSLTVGEVGLGTNILVVNSSGNLLNGAPPTGQLNVTGAGTGTGTLDFGGGILNVTGSISGSVTLGDGILSGDSTSPTTGLIAGVADLLGGQVSPDLNQPGMLRFEGGLGFNGAGYSVNINGLTAGTGYDQLNVVGAVSLSSDVALTLSVGFQPAIGDKFAIVLNDGAADPVVTSAFFTSGVNVLEEGDAIFVSPFHEFTISYQGGDGNDIELTYAVPEPGAITLLLGGLATMCARRRRKR